MRVARSFLDEVRDGLLAAGDGPVTDGVATGFGGLGVEVLATRLAERVRARLAARHRRVLNATGVVLHTGIGRAPLAAAARAAVVEAAGYAVVEVDLASGERNEREEHVAELLCELLAVDGALVVNNNAAAVNLCLRALCEGREAVVSRGELVEIGGGFRMPDVMAQAGCRMVEVGATNRTHLRDYADALRGEATGLLVKVHPSNYRILGFHSVPDLAALVALGREHGVPVFEDLGSGLLLEAEAVPEALAKEARVLDSVRSGAEVVCFSGDKLLGGPQAGILVGDRDHIARCRRHPLYRAFRCDKLTLAALEATLRIYRDGEPLVDVPTLRAIARPVAELEERARDLVRRLDLPGCEVVETDSYVGSGANPARPMVSRSVALPGGAERAARLRRSEPLPVFPRVADGRVLLDLRTLADEDLDEVAAAVRSGVLR